MSSTIVRVGWFAGVLTTALLPTAVMAQAPRPKPDELPFPVTSQVSLPPEAARPAAGVGMIEIYNGPRRTVRYVAPTLSPGERAALRDLERAENEAAYSQELLALKREYVDSDLILEPYRRSVQQQLYGYSSETTTSGFAGGGFNYGGYGYGVFPYYSGLGGSYGSAFGGVTSTVSRSLAYGMGDEGRLKEAMAKEIAAQATPEYAAAAAHNADVALGRAVSYDRVARGFGTKRSDVLPAAAETSHVILTLKTGEKIDGMLQGEDANWFRVETPTSTISIRKADVTRVEQPKK